MTRRSILIVAPFLPWPADFGGASRVYHLLRELAREHEVMLLSPATSYEWPAGDELGKICDVTMVPAAWTPRYPAGRRKRIAQLRAIAGGHAYLERSARHPQVQAAIDRLFLTRKIDLVQFEFSQMGIYHTPRPCPTVVDVHNVEHLLLQRVARTSPSGTKRAFNLLEYRRVRSLERRAWRAATLCVATSADDAARVEALSGVPALVVPNGVDTGFYDRIERCATTPRIVFTGAMRHAPNADGARWYLDRVHPLVQQQIPEIEFAIVGADPPSDLLARRTAGIDVTGHVTDVRPWLARASVAIVPLRAGGGTRLKILEALAAGVPVVSTSIGAEGLDLQPESDILLADTPEAFAAEIVRLLRLPDLAGRLAERGRTTARERFDWRLVSQRLVAAHQQAIVRFEGDTEPEGR